MGLNASAGMNALRPAQVRLGLLAILALAAALMFGTLTFQPLWGDEAVRLQWARGEETGAVNETPTLTIGRDAPVAGLEQALRVGGQYGPPGYIVVLNTWLHLAPGADDFTLRLPFALFGLGAVLGAFLAGRELGGARVGLVAAGLAAVSPFNLRYAQEVNHYAMGLFFATFAAFCFFRLLNRRDIASAVLMGLSATAGLYVHYFIALEVVSMALGVVPFVLRASRRDRLVLMLPFVLIAIGFGPYVPGLRSQILGLTDASFTGEFHGWSVFAERLTINPVWPLLGELAEELTAFDSAAIAVLFAGLAGLGIQSVADAKLRWVLVCGLAGPFAAVFGAFWLTHNNTYLWPRYGLFFTVWSYLPLALVIARGIRAISILSATAAFGLMACGMAFFLTDFQKEDWRGAGQFINERAAKGDEILVFPPIFGPSLARYVTVEARMTSLPEVAALTELIDAQTARHEQIFVSIAWEKVSPIPAFAIALLSCKYSAVDETRVEGLRVLHFHRRTPGINGRRLEPCDSANFFERVAEGCSGDGSAPVLVRGWVEVPADEFDFAVKVAGVAQPARVLSSELITGGRRAKVRKRFEAEVDLLPYAFGFPVHVGVEVKQGDGPPKPMTNVLTCLRRPPFLDAPWPIEPVERAVLSPIHSISEGHELKVDGWAYSSLGLSALRVMVDGREALRTREHGFRAEDVAGAFRDLPHDLAAYSRFSFAVGSAGLSPGQHTLALEAVHPDGSVRAIGDPAAFSLTGP